MSGTQKPTVTQSAKPDYAAHIKHVVIIVQENRSFDNMFYGYPGADTATSGKMSDGTTVALHPWALEALHDIRHMHFDWSAAYDAGRLDAFDKEFNEANDPKFPYAYVPPSELQPYWTMAGRFVLADRMFQSNSGPSYPAHQYLIAGQSAFADENPLNVPWGCDAPPKTTVPVINANGFDVPGPYPCFSYQTIADLLDAKGLTWRYYAPTVVPAYGNQWSAFDAIQQVRLGPEWATNVISPETTILTDIANGQLAAVTWVAPQRANSDHPGTGSNAGPQWVASVVNAVGQSKFWSDTVIYVTWDDWGGWYDHVPPPQIDRMGLGFRVPLLIVSPWSKHGYVSHTTHEFSSILKMTEETFGLPSLGQRDARADDLSDCFDLTQKPASYQPLGTTISPATFLRETAPQAPPDTD